MAGQDLPRQVGRVCTGMEPWQLFTLTEQVTWTKSGGKSICGPSASSRESPSRMLKESWSWLTVLESDIERSSPSTWEQGPWWSSYSTTRSVSLSVMMPQLDRFSAHKTSTSPVSLLSNAKPIHQTYWFLKSIQISIEKWAKEGFDLTLYYIILVSKPVQSERSLSASVSRQCCSPSSVDGSASMNISSVALLLISPSSESSCQDKDVRTLASLNYAVYITPFHFPCRDLISDLLNGGKQNKLWTHIFFGWQRAVEVVMWIRWHRSEVLWEDIRELILWKEHMDPNLLCYWLLITPRAISPAPILPELFYAGLGTPHIVAVSATASAGSLNALMSWSPDPHLSQKASSQILHSCPPFQH